MKETAAALFRRLAETEAAVHGTSVDEVHFHEVGAVDSIVDLCGAAVVLDLLGWPRVLSAPPELGRGLVKTAHGMLPVPAPAVLELLTGRPVRPGGPPGEAVTPTGAAILAELCEVGPLPAFVPGRIGYGVGTVAWPDRPNVLRMTEGEPAPASAASPGGGPGAAAEPETIWVLEANLDDCPGQLVARAIEVALEAGALDAWAAPVTMKKGRPGFLLSALVEEPARAAVTRVFFALDRSGNPPRIPLRSTLSMHCFCARHATRSAGTDMPLTSSCARRKVSDCIVSLSGGNPHVAAYLRRAATHAVLVVANLGGTAVSGVTIGSVSGVLPAGNYAPHDLVGGPDAVTLRVSRDGRIADYVPAVSLGPRESLVLDLIRR